MTYYHGTLYEFTAYVGICLTTDDDAARHYGEVHRIELDTDGLTVLRVPGYDREINEAPADRADNLAAWQAQGVDVLVYDDESEQGREHDCVRLISDRAVARIQVVD
jgi:hypothetical protein